jgi:hypothetical protein
VKFGILITVLIAVALLSFIIDPSSMSLFNSDPMEEDIEVASINGNKVTYTEFNDQYQMYQNAYPYELHEMYVLQQNPNLTSEQVRDLYHNRLRMTVLNNMIMNDYFVPRAKQAGFNVSDEEMYQLLSGQIYSEVIASEFGGQMTPALLKDMEENSNTAMWDNIKKSVEQERYSYKYFNVFAKSMFSNSLLVEDNIKNSNNVFDVEFVMVPYEAADNASIVVSDDEIKDYYAAHQHLFPCSETRDLAYVIVDVNEETEDAEYEKLDTLFNGVTDVKTFLKLAAENNYPTGTQNAVDMYADAIGSVSGAANVVKWAFKEPEAGSISEIFTISEGDNTYLMVVAVDKINEAGFAPVEDDQVRMYIENILLKEKAADVKLAEVSEKVKGLTDLQAIADALGTTVSTREKLAFASADFDQKFTGAASVAELNVVSDPFKGSNCIYVFKVTNASQEGFFTENDAQMKEAQMNYMYGQVHSNVANKEAGVKDYTYLYF